MGMKNCNFIQRVYQNPLTKWIDGIQEYVLEKKKNQKGMCEFCNKGVLKHGELETSSLPQPTSRMLLEGTERQSYMQRDGNQEEVVSIIYLTQTNNYHIHSFVNVLSGICIAVHHVHGVGMRVLDMWDERGFGEIIAIIMIIFIATTTIHLFFLAKG